MKKRTGLVLILLVLTLSLTTVALTQQNSQTPLMWTLTQTTALQSTPKDITVTWGNEIRANTNITSDQWFPSVSCFSDGSFVVAWEGRPGGAVDICVKLFDSSGRNKTDDILVNGNTSGQQEFPSVCCLSGGSFVVAWQSNHDGDYNVYFRLFNSTGHNQTKDILVNGYTTNDQVFPSVCCFPDNSGFVISWNGEGQGDTSGVYAKVFNSTMGDNQTDDIQVNTYTANAQEYPSVCCFSNRFVVAWQSNGQDTSGYGVYAQIFNKTGDNQTDDDILVNGNITNYQVGPSVCCFYGGFVVAWMSNQAGTDYEVYVKVFNSTGGNTTDDILVNTYASGDQRNPSVCCFSDDSFVVAWDSFYQDTDWYGVFAKVFNSTGGNLTGDIQVNNYTTDNQERNSVCCFYGGFVVAWQSYEQEGSGYAYDVYFRIGYLPSPPSVLPLLLLMAVFFAQSGAGVGVPLLVGGVLAVAVVAIVLIYWLWKRGS
nr:hypothetical protein [Candidatus Freyarchaeota archaeon]